MVYYLCAHARALVVQRIGHRLAEPVIEVRFLSRAWAWAPFKSTIQTERLAELNDDEILVDPVPERSERYRALEGTIKYSMITRQNTRGISPGAVVFIIISISIVALGIYLIWTNIPHEEISRASFSVEERNGYVAYEPKSFVDSSIKRVVIVIPPGDNPELDMQYWSGQADKHGLLLVGVHDWTTEGLSILVDTIQTYEQTDKLYLTGFSHGGYTSCSIGFENQDKVSGIIPMGAWCSDIDLGTSVQTVPVLAVFGDNDNYAHDDEGNIPDFFYTIDSELILVPGLNHSFPLSAMDQVGDWIMQH